MIEVDHACPNARERRAVQGGWGAVHWVACIPQYIPLIALAVFGATVNVMVGDILPPFLTSGFLIGTLIVWWLGALLVQTVMAREAAKSPAGGTHCRWTLDLQSIRIDNELMSSVIDWAAVKAVREEHDRFLLLIAPMNNPVLPKRQMTAEQIVAMKALVADVTASGRLGRGVD